MFINDIPLNDYLNNNNIRLAEYGEEGYDWNYIDEDGEEATLWVMDSNK